MRSCSNINKLSTCSQSSEPRGKQPWTNSTTWSNTKRVIGSSCWQCRLKTQAYSQLKQVSMRKLLPTWSRKTSWKFSTKRKSTGRARQQDCEQICLLLKNKCSRTLTTWQNLQMHCGQSRSSRRCTYLERQKAQTQSSSSGQIQTNWRQSDSLKGQRLLTSKCWPPIRTSKESK